MNDVQVLGLRLANPLVIGSGLLTDQERNIRKLLAAGAGAVVTKTIHPNPPTTLDERIVRIPTGMLNSTTYSKRPVSWWLRLLRSLADDRSPVIASIHADSPEELGSLAEAVVLAGAPALELGISCLNEEEGELQDTPERVLAYTRAVRQRVTVPIAVKLGIGEGLADRVTAALEGGTDAITISDTIPGAAIADDGQLALGGVYGYSGPGIKPLVLAAIVRLRRRGFDVPILASGGVTSGADVHDYLRVGASVAQVYTALHTTMFDTLRRLLDEVASAPAAAVTPDHATVAG
jgi:dihydroorotate dehydrogenase (fumarate)/dihydroorotate dehydrogenase (NAD+) catalytic subunit